MPECERCDREYDSLATIDVGDLYEVCDACILAITEDIEYYDWRERYTEEQHERALSLLSDRDKIQCVIESYEDGAIILHTPYVSSDVVTDFCNHFGYRIVSFTLRWEETETWPCAKEHGDSFEIVLEYDHNCEVPFPIDAKFDEYHVDELDENDKQF